MVLSGSANVERSLPKAVSLTSDMALLEMFCAV